MNISPCDGSAKTNHAISSSSSSSSSRDSMASLIYCAACRKYKLATSYMLIKWTRTLGSKFKAVVKCLMAFPLSCNIL